MLCIATMAIVLALTLRPLALPLLVVLAAGTFRFSWVVQALAGAAAVLIAWWLVISPEVGRLRKEAGREKK